MRSFGVVFDPPGLDDPTGLRQRHEPVLVEALVAKLSVEAFDVSILNRLAGTDKTQTDALLVRLSVEHLAFELRTVVDRD